MKLNRLSEANRCEICFRDGKYLCKVFIGTKLWSVIETNFKGLKKVLSLCKKRDYSRFNML